MPTSRTGTSTDLFPDRPPQAGFTLLELAVVLLLIGLFSALILPVFGGFGDGALKAEARRLAATVRHLYNESALSGRPYRLRFDLDRGTYGGRRLEEDGSLVAVSGSGGDHALPAEVRIRDIVVAGRGRSSSGETEVRILPVGWVDETVIHLGGAGEHALTLRLQPLTGGAEVYEGYREF